MLGDYLPFLDQIDLQVFFLTVRWELTGRMSRIKGQSVFHMLSVV